MKHQHQSQRKPPAPFDGESSSDEEGSSEGRRRSARSVRRRSQGPAAADAPPDLDALLEAAFRAATPTTPWAAAGTPGRPRRRRSRRRRRGAVKRGAEQGRLVTGENLSLSSARSPTAPCPTPARMLFGLRPTRLVGDLVIEGEGEHCGGGSITVPSTIHRYLFLTRSRA